MIGSAAKASIWLRRPSARARDRRPPPFDRLDRRHSVVAHRRLPRRVRCRNRTPREDRRRPRRDDRPDTAPGDVTPNREANRWGRTWAQSSVRLPIGPSTAPQFGVRRPGARRPSFGRATAVRLRRSGAGLFHPVGMSVDTPVSICEPASRYDPAISNDFMSLSRRSVRRSDHVSNPGDTYSRSPDASIANSRDPTGEATPIRGRRSVLSRPKAGSARAKSRPKGLYIYQSFGLLIEKPRIRIPGQWIGAFGEDKR